MIRLGIRNPLVADMARRMVFNFDMDSRIRERVFRSEVIYTGTWTESIDSRLTVPTDLSVMRYFKKELGPVRFLGDKSLYQNNFLYNYSAARLEECCKRILASPEKHWTPEAEILTLENLIMWEIWGENETLQYSLDKHITPIIYFRKLFQKI